MGDERRAFPVAAGERAMERCTLAVGRRYPHNSPVRQQRNSPQSVPREVEVDSATTLQQDGTASLRQHVSRSSALCLQSSYRSLSLPSREDVLAIAMHARQSLFALERNEQRRKMNSAIHVCIINQILSLCRLCPSIPHLKHLPSQTQYCSLPPTTGHT